jgi:hypothetical protein
VGEQLTYVSEEALLREYYEIFYAVEEFDKGLITVKGWGAILSLAALAWGSSTLITATFSSLLSANSDSGSSRPL